MMDLQAVTLVSVLGGMGGLYLLQFKISSAVGRLQEQMKSLITRDECNAQHMDLLREREADTRDCDTRHSDLHREREADRVAVARLEAGRRSSPGAAGGGP